MNLSTIWFVVVLALPSLPSCYVHNCRTSAHIISPLPLPPPSISQTISQSSFETMAPKKQVARPQENVSLGPQVREGELVFGVARIFASKYRVRPAWNISANCSQGFNDTFVHITDLS